MIKLLLTKLAPINATPQDHPELLNAQLRVGAQQFPLMFLILTVNLWTLAACFIGVAPHWLSIYVPLIFSIMFGYRAFSWHKLKNIQPSAVITYTALNLVKRRGVIFAVLLVIWILVLFPYSDGYLHLRIGFFVAMTSISLTIFFQRLHSIAYVVAAITTIPIIIFAIYTQNSNLAAMMVNISLVTMILLGVIRMQTQHFIDTVDARLKLENIGAENLQIANRDSLTGLTNRRQFFSHLRELFIAAKKENKRIAIGIIDLDGFKPVNDLYGHAIGDSLLIQVGQRLTALTDEHTSVSRLGGDEFAITFTDCPTDAELLNRGNKFCETLREPFAIADAYLEISGSIGFATFPELAKDAEQLYERADYALYHSKHNNRGEAFLFSQEHIQEIDVRKRLEQALSKADFKTEMNVVFQPIIDCKIQQTVAFEALARWNSPEMGSVSPFHFIPAAERLGLVNGLTRILLDKALKVALTWPDDIRLSFNLSAHDICSAEGISHILDIIHTNGIDPNRLDFEITETAMMHDHDQAFTSIEMLKVLGCGIALDDFGTGYSSLTQLHAMPLTKIKIDRSFVAGLNEYSDSFKIVKSLISLSSDMGIGCILEGVETADELEAIQSLGGQFVQGYFYSKPMQESETAKFIDETSSLRFFKKIKSA